MSCRQQAHKKKEEGGVGVIECCSRLNQCCREKHSASTLANNTHQECEVASDMFPLIQHTCFLGFACLRVAGVGVWIAAQGNDRGTSVPLFHQGLSYPIDAVAACAGYGATPAFPNSCQLCPIGTYANGLAEISNIPGVPPQGGKGVIRGFESLSGATLVRCTPCCPAGVGMCALTTNAPGSLSYKACVAAPIPLP